MISLSVGLSALLNTTVIRAKTAEAIEVQFGMVTYWSKKPCVGWGFLPSVDTFFWGAGACADLLKSIELDLTGELCTNS